jgi:hypothetical protein
MDPTKLTFTYENDNGPRYVLELDVISGVSACAPGVAGAYYDDPIAPHEIIACPDVCGQLPYVNAPTGSKLSALQGCAPFCLGS